MTHPHAIHCDQNQTRSRSWGALRCGATCLVLRTVQDGKHGLAVGLPRLRLTVRVDDLPVNLAGRHGPVPFSYRTRSFLSLTSGRRNRMAGCAKRQSRAGTRRIYTSGQFSLTTGTGRGSANYRLPTSHSHRRVFSSLSRRYWHGVQRHSLRSAVPFLIRGAFHRSRILCKSEHHTDCQVSDAPKHFNRVLSCSTPLVSHDANGKDLTRGSQSLSSDDKTYD